MTPEYLEELADLADPDKLWQLGAFEQLDLPTDRRRQLDCGVALRRYASHLRELQALLQQKRSLLITPLGEGSTAVKSVDTPPDHERLRKEREPRQPVRLVNITGPHDAASVEGLMRLVEDAVGDGPRWSVKTEQAIRAYVQRLKEGK